MENREPCFKLLLTVSNVLAACATAFVVIAVYNNQYQEIQPVFPGLREAQECCQCSIGTPSPTSSAPVQTPPPSVLLKPLRSDGDNNVPSSAFPLPECSGDCDNDSDCFGDLLCYQRSDLQSVPGCSEDGIKAKDYCYKNSDDATLTYTGDNEKPARSFPLGMCEGDCDSDSDCAGSLRCFQRDGIEHVPGCTGDGISGKDYCSTSGTTASVTPTTVRPTTAIPTTAPAKTATPTISPHTNSPLQSVNPTTPGERTYRPGELTVFKEGLRLSTGLDVRKIATKDQPVQYANGGQSAISFHTAPDGAAVFVKDDGSGNYYYVSNSESSTTGGVGSIEFDSKGNVLGYQRVLSDTKRNCSGGRSPYNTWLSCEENLTSGFVWEVSPSGQFQGRKTNLVPYGGNFETVAFRFDETLGRNVYYITEDSQTGALIQFTPSANLGTREEMYSPGTYKFLRVDSGNVGSFSWVDAKSDATPQFYPSTEGIDIKDGRLYLVSKVDKTLFILDLAAGTFTKESTNQGLVSSSSDVDPEFSLLPDVLSGY
jgi:Bacterial protein of unknown function (DUF839)